MFCVEENGQHHGNIHLRNVLVPEDGRPFMITEFLCERLTYHYWRLIAMGQLPVCEFMAPEVKEMLGEARDLFREGKGLRAGVSDDARQRRERMEDFGVDEDDENERKSWAEKMVKLFRSIDRGKADVFSLGLVMFCLLRLEEPRGADSDPRKIVRRLRRLKEVGRNTVLLQLVACMLEFEPDNRPSWEEICKATNQEIPLETTEGRRRSIQDAAGDAMKGFMAMFGWESEEEIRAKAAKERADHMKSQLGDEKAGGEDEGSGEFASGRQRRKPLQTPMDLMPRKKPPERIIYKSGERALEEKIRKRQEREGGGEGVDGTQDWLEAEERELKGEKTFNTKRRERRAKRKEQRMEDLEAYNDALIVTDKWNDFLMGPAPQGEGGPGAEGQDGEEKEGKSKKGKGKGKDTNAAGQDGECKMM
eukprot:Cvel_35431.t1-p1 / transcript=Cvel_35431.t1 / gene=Cvel_35431 / organism=Chromera_velia_CCMP2878 / gene_product=hypothetical protein / transcript_product=hypothetical protein / location=Cvel_scaffold6471:288-2644(-) / protein_length=419 / sequence_SO=supercontig / SO=protein_coding / is_pseudo=false